MGAPVPACLAVRRRSRRGGYRLRPALRGVLRADRARADALARSAQSSDDAAARGDGHRRDPACPGVLSWHDQPVAGRRLAGRAVRAVGGCGYLLLPRRGRRRRRLVPAPGPASTRRHPRRSSRAGTGPHRFHRRGWRWRRNDAGVGRGLRLRRPAGLQCGVIHPAGRVRPHPRRARHARMGRHTSAVGPRRGAGRGRGDLVRRGNCAGVQPGGAGRCHPGIAAGVLRVVLACLPGTGSAVQAVARPPATGHVAATSERESVPVFSVGEGGA